MNIIQLINIFKRHILLLISVPVIMAVVVTYLTRNPVLQYESETIIYTGIASGYNLEQKDKFDLFGSRNAFDNLINVVKSRETIGETALRLYAKCLSLDAYQKEIISKPSFIEMRRITPEYIKQMVERPVFTDSASVADSYENTVRKLTRYLNANDTNFIYNLLNYKHRFFSIKAVSSVIVNRVQSSDLVELKYKSEDPGITLQTLKIMTEVFIRNFQSLKENQSDAVVSYFQKQVDNAKFVLADAENELLEFNKGNRIINYYEQSKAIASKKEEIEESIQIEKMKKAGAEQAIKNLENQLQVQGRIQGISDKILIKRNRLIEINEKLTINELYNEPDTASKNEMARLRVEADLLEQELNRDLNSLYSFSNTTDGLPISGLLDEWLANLIKLAEANAGLKVLYNREEDFKKNYDKFAPLGANISRIERQIDVAEREYLSLLSSLNEAKLKQQNEQLSSNIKPLDPPFFPLSAIPSKRKILILAAGMFGFILVAFSILLTEYFDNTIKNMGRAVSLTGLESVGIMPKIIGKYRNYNLEFITNRLIELLLQEIKYHVDKQGDDSPDGHISQNKFIIFFSISQQEGKSFLANKFVNKIRATGDRVIYLNYQFAKQQEDEERKKKEVTKEKKLINILSNPLQLIQLSSTVRKSEKILRAIENKDNITYTIDDTFSEKTDLFDLITTQEIVSFDNFKYVVLEIPAILEHYYPSAIVSQSDMNILTARSNREWKSADSAALEMYSQFTKAKPLVFLNGTEIEEIEGVLGTLPKKRSQLRIMIKQLLRFQFYTKSSIG